MTVACVDFVRYDSQYLYECLDLFDDNCPMYFAENERQDYEDFLALRPEGYEVLVLNDEVIGAYGLVKQEDNSYALNWILIASKAQGLGLGTKIMHRLKSVAILKGVKTISIAASHLSAPFFERFGARTVAELEHGWGPNMHRIDMKLAL